MAETDIIVTTRYTTEGYDAALRKADRIGQTMLKLSRDIGSLGRAFGSEFLTNLGNSLGVIEDMIGATSELSNSLTALNKIRLFQKGAELGVATAGIGLGAGLGSAAGGAFIGSKIYDATIGKAQGTDTAKIIDQLGTLFKYGFDTTKIIADLKIQATNVQLNALNTAVSNIGKTELEKRGYSGPKDIEGMRAALELYYKQLEKMGGMSVGIPLATNAADAAQNAAKASVEGMIHALQLEIRRMEQEASAKLAQGRIAGAFDDIGSRIKTATVYQAKLASASQTYHAAEFDRKMKIAQLEAETSARRIAAAQSLAADLAKMDSTYYANRLKLAESFGLETQRAEEDHQRNMRRMQESHDKRLRKLAESRDALGIEDEVDAFEEERRNAEEDYQVQQERRNQDFALQLRDMEQAFQQQRQERIAAYNQQLVDIAAYNTAQRDLIAAQMRDIAEAILKAFTDAAKNYTNSQNTTNNTSQSVVQNNTINGVNDPLAISEMINARIKSVFDTAARR